MLSESNYDEIYDDDFYDDGSPSSNMSHEEESGLEENIVSRNTYETSSHDWSTLDADPSVVSTKRSVALNAVSSSRTYSKFNSSMTICKSSRIKLKKVKVPFRKKNASKRKEKKKKVSKVIPPDTIIERILSANRKRSNDLHNTIYEMQKQIDDLTIDNKLLKRDGTLTEHELRNVQITKDLMRMHSNELRVIKSKYRDEKKISQTLGKDTKRIESELHKTKDKLKKLEVMASEKNLGERVDLKNTISNLENVVEKKNSALIILNRSLHLQKKIHSRVVKEKDQKLIKTNEKLKIQEQSKKGLLEKIQEGEKKLAKTNIYSHLAMKARNHKSKKSKKSNNVDSIIVNKKAYTGNCLEKDVHTMVSKLGFTEAAVGAQSASFVDGKDKVEAKPMDIEHLIIRPKSGRLLPQKETQNIKDVVKTSPKSGKILVHKDGLNQKDIDDSITDVDESVDDFFDINGNAKGEVERLHQRLDDMKHKEQHIPFEKDLVKPTSKVKRISFEEEEHIIEIPSNKVNSEKELNKYKLSFKDVQFAIPETIDISKTGNGILQASVSGVEKDEVVALRSRETRRKKSWEFNRTDENMHKGLPAHFMQSTRRSHSIEMDDLHSNDDLGRGYSPTPLRKDQHIVNNKKGRIFDCFSEFEDPFSHVIRK